MKRTMSIIAILLAMAGSGIAQGQTVETKDYAIYAGSETRTLEAMTEALAQADVVFIGEQHDHTLGHRLKFDILKAMYGRKPKLALSLEMFERDVQSILDEYLMGHITENAFLQASRPWPNYRTDYRPMVEFCKENRLPVVAANTPRRYVNIVSRKGQTALAELPKESKAFLPSLPYPMDIPAEYDRQLNEIFGGHGTGNATGNDRAGVTRYAFDGEYEAGAGTVGRDDEGLGAAFPAQESRSDYRAGERGDAQRFGLWHRGQASQSRAAPEDAGRLYPPGGDVSECGCGQDRK